ncbi:exopolysaccharide biosynthesis protein [Mameliella sediminis]|uniref:exopolysaccharide biosynthesis protein n=1 Tax=Mameliella sediminis TaxID=2836866 RepID=UPI001C43A25E|nr:exopolysaccharide biosynthesis protein [Mameliella sediminis]MBY6115017.1 exopolysaccharide biosynthesis protein [Antarctobacter heliothermus]MBY6145098.1 exopolysaccharide biosynthesis protein [Mameliella alba]MBV7396205.1 exopolysaccharide biosynthesis protein [Mameliella sediminis]MBY6160615.1 exopolysaccharide biosynthesis protein [Mameliella alba]MBY6169085.1 exopolysaccharide biosynthesis protein [Mameliella alba]
MSDVPQAAEAGPLRNPQSLGELLDAMRPKPGAERVSVGDVMSRVGDQSFAAVILVVAIVLVSPISGIPGTPTFGALITILVSVQALLGRRHLWLPGFLCRRSISAKKMTRGIDWLSKPAAWMDRHSSGRLKLLSSRPIRPFAFAAVTLIALSWPVLELLPFVTSFFAGAVAMMMFGVMTRDGIYLLAGYVQAGVLVLILFSIWSGLI